MNIALICNEYPPFAAGGIGTWTQAYAHALHAAGDRVWIIGGYSLPERVEENDQGIHVIRLPSSTIPKWQAIGNRLATLRELNQIHREFHLDIVEVPDFQGQLAFYNRIAPLVVRLHNFPRRWAGGHTNLSWFERRNLKNANAIVAITRWCADVFSGLQDETRAVEVIYYTIASCFLNVAPVPRDENLVICPGTLADHKGVWQLAEAWEILKPQFPRAKLVMIGKDYNNNRARLQQRLSGLDVEFINHVSQEELVNWYRRASVVCLPSYMETFGLVAAEAMATQTPLIYTTEGAGKEIGGDNRALLVNPYNPLEIAEAMKTILTHPEQYRERAKIAAEWVRKNLTPEATIPKSRELYQKLIQQRKRSK